VEAIALTQQATLETRQAKHEPRSLAEQRQRWRTQAIELLGSREALPGLLAHVLSGRRRPAQPITQEWIDEQARRVITTVAETRVVWRATHVYAEAQRRVRATGHAGYDTLAQQIAAVALSAPYSLAVGVDRDADLGEPDPLRRRDGESVFATHHTRQFTNGEVFAAERRILAAAGRFDGRRAELADVELALETQAGLGHTLNAGQEALVRHMATCRARVALTLTPAGTGKTTAMATLARAWQNGGGTIVGLAPSAAAAEALRQDIGVDATDTIAKYRWLQRTPPEDRDPAPAREWFDTIGPDTPVVIDEAGQAGTLHLDTVIGCAVARGASVRLIGDDQQLASISAGGVLCDIRHRHGAKTLLEVVRFEDNSEPRPASTCARVTRPRWPPKLCAPRRETSSAPAATPARCASAPPTTSATATASRSKRSPATARFVPATSRGHRACRPRRRNRAARAHRRHRLAGAAPTPGHAGHRRRRPDRPAGRRHR